MAETKPASRHTGDWGDMMKRQLGGVSTSLKHSAEAAPAQLEEPEAEVAPPPPPAREQAPVAPKARTPAKPKVAALPPSRPPARAQIPQEHSQSNERGRWPSDAYVNRKFEVDRNSSEALDKLLLELSAAAGDKVSLAVLCRALVGIAHHAQERIETEARRRSPQLRRPATHDSLAMGRYEEAWKKILSDAFRGMPSYIPDGMTDD
jgi:hypothetical protein